MVACADSVDDLVLLRHGGMGRVFAHAYAPATLVSFLRPFTLGHVGQLDAIASRFLIGLAGLTGLFATDRQWPDGSGYVLLEVDDTMVEVNGYAKQGAGVGHWVWAQRAARHAGQRRVAPLIVAQRLRKGATGRHGGQASGRRRGEEHATAAGQVTADPGGHGLGVLRPRPGSRCAGVEVGSPPSAGGRHRVRGQDKSPPPPPDESPY